MLNQRNLAETDRVCGDFHGWKDGDFGEVPVAMHRVDEAGLLMSQLESVLHLQVVGLPAEQQQWIGGWLALGSAPVFLILTLAAAVAAFRPPHHHRVPLLCLTTTR